MDRLRAFILIHHAIVQRERLRLRAVVSEGRMTPNVRAVAGAMAKLRHGLDKHAVDLLKRIPAIDEAASGAFKDAHAELDASEAAVKEVTDFVADMRKGSNGGPSLGNSEEPSKEPQASMRGEHEPG